MRFICADSAAQSTNRDAKIDEISTASTREDFLTFRARFQHPVAIAFLGPPVFGQGRYVPARTLPVPDTVSPQIRKLIAAPPRPGWNVLPKTGEEWKPVADAGAAGDLENAARSRERMKVKIESP
jgi:hypothetical protein